MSGSACSNLFNTAIFCLHDRPLHRSSRASASTGFIAVGGSPGATAGAYITKHFVGQIGPANLLAILWPSCCASSQVPGSILSRLALPDRHEPEEAKEAPIGGSGLVRSHLYRAVAVSPRSGGPRCCSTRSLRPGPHFQQSDLAREAFAKEGPIVLSSSPTSEIWVNSITVLIQIFLTGRLLKWFGVGITLVAMPFPEHGSALRRWGLRQAWRYWRSSKSRGGPLPMRCCDLSREILFTVLRREDKYKVKSA